MITFMPPKTLFSFLMFPPLKKTLSKNVPEIIEMSITRVWLFAQYLAEAP